jgi:hypothetical protein
MHILCFNTTFKEEQHLRDDGRNGSAGTGERRLHYARRRPDDTTLYQ